MEYSSGTRSVMGEVIGWSVAVCMIALAVVNFDTLRHSLSSAAGIPLSQDATSNGGPEAEKAAAGEPARSGYSVELEAGDNGHYHADAEINGRSVNVMVDTGASMVALTYEDAEAAGIYLRDSDFTQRASTANGIARIAPVTLDRVSIGDITVRNVQAAVSERGQLSTTLLGMTFLSRLEHIEMSGGKLHLKD